MSENYTTWEPTKPAELYSDEEIRNTPLFNKIQENISVAGGGVSLPEGSIIRLSRDAIEEMWKTLQITRYSAPVVACFEAYEEGGERHDNELTIKLVKDDNGNRIGIIAPPKGKRSKRFGHSNYADFIGQGTPKDSPLYRECVQALQDKCGLDASVLKGGFLLCKDKMRSPTRNGVFELVLEKGRDGNGVTDAFVAKLYQFPFEEQSVPVVQFPPVSGKKDDLRQTDEVKEVPSMSQMLKQSILESAMTPAVMFGLTELLKEGKVSSNNADDSDDDGDDGDDEQDSSNSQTVEQPKATAAAPVPAPAKSAAHALLDDDDE